MQACSGKNADSTIKNRDVVEVQQARYVSIPRTTVQTTNVILSIFLILCAQYAPTTSKDFKKINQAKVNPRLLINLSAFLLPKRSHKVIFLRAPYKNKLARLNIINLCYTSIISLKVPIFTPTHKFAQTSEHILENIRPVLYRFLPTFDLSTAKLQHAKTKYEVFEYQPSNYVFSKFNDLH